jgi:hypothetical protein
MKVPTYHKRNERNLYRYESFYTYLHNHLRVSSLRARIRINVLDDHNINNSKSSKSYFTFFATAKSLYALFATANSLYTFFATAKSLCTFPATPKPPCYAKS